MQDNGPEAFADLASLQDDLRYRPQHLRFILLSMLTSGLAPLGMATITPKGRVAYFRMALFYRVNYWASLPLSCLDPHIKFLEAANSSGHFSFPAMRPVAQEAVSSFCQLCRELMSAEASPAMLPRFVDHYRRLPLFHETPDARVRAQWQRENPGYAERADMKTMRLAMSTLNQLYQTASKYHGDEDRLWAQTFNLLPRVSLEYDDPAIPQDQKDSRTDPYDTVAYWSRKRSSTLFGQPAPREHLMLDWLRSEDFWAEDPASVVPQIRSLFDESNQFLPRLAASGPRGLPITDRSDLLSRVSDARAILNSLPLAEAHLGQAGPEQRLDDFLTAYDLERGLQALNTIEAELGNISRRPDQSVLRRAFDALDAFSRKLTKFCLLGSGLIAAGFLDEVGAQAFREIYAASPHLQLLFRQLVEFAIQII